MSQRSRAIAIILAIGLAIAGGGVVISRRQQARDPGLRPVVRVPFGPNKVVEVVGLRRWTVAMIQDSLGKYAPGETLESHACAANLRELLHFADADAMTFNDVSIFGPDTTREVTIVVSVREPGDSARTRYRKMPTTDTTLRADWAALTDLSRHHTGDFETLAEAFLAAPGDNRMPIDLTAKQAGMLAYLRARTTSADWDTATTVLARSPSAPDRGIAALILANFPERDETWHALLRAAVEEHQWLDAGLAQATMASLARRHPRSVDWTPVAPLIHDMLDGMALPVFGDVVSTLLVTGAASPANAKSFLQGGGEMLAAYLETSRSEIRDPVRQLLIGLRGADLGPRREPWMRWIATL